MPELLKWNINNSNGGALMPKQLSYTALLNSRATFGCSNINHHCFVGAQDQYYSQFQCNLFLVYIYHDLRKKTTTKNRNTTT